MRQGKPKTSEAKLKAAQDTTAAYRNHHAVLFPEMQATADTTVEGKVWDNLIEAKTAFNAQLAVGVSANSMQMRMLGNRITAMEIGAAGGSWPPGTVRRRSADASLASVMSEYDVLHLDQETAAKVHERALMALAGCEERGEPAKCLPRRLRASGLCRRNRRIRFAGAS